MNPQRTLIHIGYHKTGSTWLQDILFQPEYGYTPLMNHREVFENIVRPHGLLFHPQGAKKLILERTKKLDSKMVGVISSEILSGNPFYGGRESDQFAQHLYKINPNARILISIRSQVSMIVSVYMQYISRGGTLSLKEFFSDNPIIGYTRFAPEHFEYHRLIALYYKLFGTDNVMVATQESLAKNALSFAQSISSFANAIPLTKLNSNQVGTSHPEYTAWLLRRINHFRSGPVSCEPMINLGLFSNALYRIVGALGRQKIVKELLKNSRPIRNYIENRFEGRFKESNRQLKAMLGDKINLDHYDF
jgi:hypothetical protein